MRRKDREVTELTGIREILDLCKTCHVAMHDGEELYLVPLSFGYALENGILTLYFHSAQEGRKIDIWKKDPKVCFEMCREGEAVIGEIPCNSGYRFSSLTGWGEVRFIEDDQAKCRALSCIFAHQTGREVTFTAQQAQTVCVYKIVSDRFTGKRKK